jgi:hypothetical protein
MPNITIKLNREQAVRLHGITMGMGGEGMYKAMHKQVRADISKAWPETDPEDGRETPPGEVRDLELDPKKQRALAEGFLRLANDPNVNGAAFEDVHKMAQLCRVWGWVEKHLAQRAVPDFDGELDGEPALLDEPAAEVAGK